MGVGEVRGQRTEVRGRGGAAVGADRLARVAERGQAPVAAGDQGHQPVLRRVEVLELVDEHVREGSTDGGAQAVVGLEGDHRVAQEVVEVEGRRGALGLLVGGEGVA